MILRLRVVAMFLILTTCPVALIQSMPQNDDRCLQNREDWVRDILIKMNSIKPGMTREKLLTVFTTQGGFSNALHRTFVSRDCLYFKVDVEFRLVGRPDRDSDGRIATTEDPRDIIVRISQPYLGFAVAD